MTELGDAERYRRLTPFLSPRNTANHSLRCSPPSSNSICLCDNLCVFYIFRHVLFPEYSRRVIPLHQALHINFPILLDSTSFFFLTFSSVTVSSTFCMHSISIRNTSHIQSTYARTRSLGSSVGIVTKLRTGQSGKRNEFLSSPNRPDRLWWPSNLLFSWNWACYPGIKRPGSESGHWPLSSAEVKNECSYTSPPLQFMACTRKTFTFAMFKLFLWSASWVDFVR